MGDGRNLLDFNMKIVYYWSKKNEKAAWGRKKGDEVYCLSFLF
jgi:hypothetical protein